jgi:dipeptidyl aminopeptidase/acylaminoacyl peptidase
MRNMFKLFILFVFLTCAAFSSFSATNRIEKGNLVIEEIPEIPDRVVNQRLKYENVRSAYLYDWIPGGNKILISTRFGDTYQLHIVESPGGTRQQITFFKEPASGASICPDPSREGFLFSKDIGGTELYQLFYFDMKTGNYLMLTDGSSRNGSGLWSNKGDRFAFYTTKRNGKDWDIYIGEIDKPGNVFPVLEKTGTWVPADWSPDDSRLLIRNFISASESYYFILEIETKELTRIHPTDAKIAYGGAEWSRDGKGIYLTSDEGSEFQQLKFYDLKSNRFTILTHKIPWDVEGFDLSKDGKYITFVTNEDGIGRIHLLNLKTRKEEKLPEIPVGQIYGLHFNDDGSRLGMVMNTPRTPGDVYVLNIEKKEIIRWTYSEVGGLKTENFVIPELIHFETFDGKMIPAFYFKPKQKGKAPFPVLIHIHGGPESQYRPYFNSTFQYYVSELGLAILAPNVRGSDGYGKSNLKLDNDYKREDSVKDIGKLLDWIKTRPELDASRVVVRGSSYGGYMVLASMTHFNDRLRAGIDIVGISNFVTFLENTKDYRRDLRRVEYGDERDPDMREFLIRISPTTNAHKITKPMFIAQGLNDPRVPVGESEQILEEIRKNGSTAWYLLAKDEGHGFSKKKNRDYFNNSAVLFLERFLLDKKEP